MGKMYVTDVPKWAQVILPDMEMMRYFRIQQNQTR